MPVKKKEELKVVCGRCSERFKDEAAYAGHVCSATGFRADSPEHLGPGFKAASEAALKRGAEKAGEK